MRKIPVDMPAEEKARYKLVRSDSLTDVEGGAEVVSADAVTGKFCLLVQKLDERGPVPAQVVGGMIQLRCRDERDHLSINRRPWSVEAWAQRL